MVMDTYKDISLIFTRNSFLSTALCGYDPYGGFTDSNGRYLYKFYIF